MRTAGWSLDLTDEAVIAKVRSYGLAGMALSGAAASGLMVWLKPGLLRGSDAPWLLIAGFAVLGLIALSGGPRWNDEAYLTLTLVGLALGTVYLGSFDSAEFGGSWEITLQASTIFPTVFCHRRRNAVIAGLAGTAAICWLAVHQTLPGVSPAGRALADGYAMVSVVVVVRVLRELAASAIRRANKGEITDALTGVTNRRGLEVLGGPAWLEQAQRQQPIAVLVVDLDHFKRINDTLGHAAGDNLLRRLGDVLHEVSRDDDVVVRLGGEEFLLLARCGPGGALALAERLRRTIEAQLPPATASIGVYEAAPRPDDTLPTTLWWAVDLADQALYEAKRTGRNRVVATTPG